VIFLGFPLFPHGDVLFSLLHPSLGSARMTGDFRKDFGPPPEEPWLEVELPPWEDLEAAAQVALEEAVAALPEVLAHAATQVPVTLEPYPNAGILKEGFEEDLLGLFVGDGHAGSGESLTPLPSQILLFLENIYLYALEAGDDFDEEVKVTYLHELGHYLGLDEDDLIARGIG